MRTPGSPGEAEARGAKATFRETSPACLCSQLGAQQQPRSPARETAKPGRGSDGGPNTVRDARSCGGRPHFEARAPPLPDVISGAGPEKGPDVLRSAPSHPHLQLFFFFPSPSLPPLRGRRWCSPVVFASRVIPFPGSAAGAGLQSLGRALPSAGRALASWRLLRPQLRERGRRGVSGAFAAILESESLGARTVWPVRLDAAEPSLPTERPSYHPAGPGGSADEKGICASRGLRVHTGGWARPPGETLGSPFRCSTPLQS